MKNPLLLALFLISMVIASCNSKPTSQSNKSDQIEYSQTIKAEFQTILDSADVEGSILILDPQNFTYYSNDFDWAKIGRLPASTFKITNSIIALESGNVNNDSTVFKWNGEKRFLKLWEQDLNLKEAFHYSCVPCYQEIARKIGSIKMNEFLKKLEYGNMQVDSNNIDRFWLEGESKISQFEQIDFISRFYENKLPISISTSNIMKELMILSQTDEYTLRGKTGWAIRNRNNNGWFVGILSVDENIYYYATNISPKEKFNMNSFSMIRKSITMKAFKLLDFIQ